MRRRRRGSVVLKSAREIELLRTANQHVAEILETLCQAARPGVSTWELDEMARAHMARRAGVSSAFLGYYGYPATVCTSVNDVIVHGIPRKDVVLVDGDIIGIDFGVSYAGYVGDSARTVGVGRVSPAAEALIQTTRECLERAITCCEAPTRLSEIGRTVQDLAEGRGYSVVRDFVGHGIGQQMHEEPQVLNYYTGPQIRMAPGLVIAIEPMLNIGAPTVRVCTDGWTAVTADGALSAHFEHSVAITENGPIVLSAL